MAKKNILITGGAGFIGSHVADEMLSHSHFVRVLDNLSAQVHGKRPVRPRYLDPRVELLVGDVRDGTAVERALEGIDVVFHFAAAIGSGQSTYDVERFTSVNNLGTAILMDRLVRRPVERLVVASSMSVYGEGQYLTDAGDLCDVGTRDAEQLARSDWEPRLHQRTLTPVPTPESKPAKLDSIYALSKHDQERMTLVLGRAYGIPTVSLRLFDVFGPRQGSSPYASLITSFASRLFKGQRPLVHEDGLQRRDFISVHDVARACRLAVESSSAPGVVLNIGTGRGRTAIEVARKMAALVGKPHLEPEITGIHRMGEIRHCFADVRRAEQVLGFRAIADFDESLSNFVRWFEDEIGDSDRVRNCDLRVRRYPTESTGVSPAPRGA
jgi:dTDP-L-rhamnose 4-epimerase